MIHASKKRSNPRSFFAGRTKRPKNGGGFFVTLAIGNRNRPNGHVAVIKVSENGASCFRINRIRLVPWTLLDECRIAPKFISFLHHASDRNPPRNTKT